MGHVYYYITAVILDQEIYLLIFTDCVSVMNQSQCRDQKPYYSKYIYIISVPYMNTTTHDCVISMNTGVLTYIGTIMWIFNIDGVAQPPDRMRSSTYLWKDEST